MIDGHFLLADWFFLISAILFVLYVIIHFANSRRTTVDGATTRSVTWVFALPYLAGALIALGLWVL